ncbi:MAG: hypothetical protein NTX25_20395 [Proteobacteria bacterium]|nr:hypothetical protein [Pseudomonadota bacterium]
MKNKDLSNEEILELEARGESLEGVVRGNGRMMPARADAPERATRKQEAVRVVARVNVDFPPELLQALDAVSERLGINRQASIKEAVLDYVDQKIDSFEKQKGFLNAATKL